MIDWEAALDEWALHSWEECLNRKEQLGGPSPCGNSKWSDFRECPYRYWWRHVKRMRRERYDVNLEVGSLFHEAVARYYVTGLDGGDDQACRQAGYDILIRADEIVPATAGEVRRLYDAWLALYGPDTIGDDRHETYDVECLMEVAEPFPYSTRLDRWAWCERLEGPVIYEFKTAGRRDGRLLSSYRSDPQFLGHQWLWNKCMKRQYGQLKGYTVVLVLKTTPARVHHETVAITPNLVREWEKSMRWYYALLIQCQMQKRWPKSQGYRCRYCGVFDVCATAGKNTAGWVKKGRGEW